MFQLTTNTYNVFIEIFKIVNQDKQNCEQEYIMGRFNIAQQKMAKQNGLKCTIHKFEW